MEAGTLKMKIGHVTKAPAVKKIELGTGEKRSYS
jgi:hypothetical protein